MPDAALVRHAGRIRAAWERVRLRHPDGRNLRPGRPQGTGPDARLDYDSELDEAWFQAMDGADGLVGGFDLWPYARSQEHADELRRLGTAPGEPLRFLPLPVGTFPGGDLLCLATLGRGNEIGKALRVSPAALALSRANAPGPSTISLAIGRIDAWIAATFVDRRR